MVLIAACLLQVGGQRLVKGFFPLIHEENKYIENSVTYVGSHWTVSSLEEAG